MIFGAALDATVVVVVVVVVVATVVAVVATVVAVVATVVTVVVTAGAVGPSFHVVDFAIPRCVKVAGVPFIELIVPPFKTSELALRPKPTLSTSPVIVV